MVQKLGARQCQHQHRVRAKILHITAQKRKPNVKHHRQADDLGARFKVAEWGVFCHSERLRDRPPRLKLVLSDSTQQSVRMKV